MKNENFEASVISASVLNAAKPEFSLLVRPVVSNQEILTAWQAYQELKSKLLIKDDFATIQGQQFAKKSAFRKLALAFGVSVEITAEKRLELPNHGFVYEITAKASSPNGRFMMAIGSAHSAEKKFTKPSDVRAIAQTRATNRAISDLLGGVLGVSAEEVISDSAQTIYESIADNEPGEEDEEQIDDVEANSAYFDKIFDSYNREDDEQDRLTMKQHNLLTKLINQKCPGDNNMLEKIGKLSKVKASAKIGELLRA